MNSMDRYKDAVQLYAKWDIDVDEVLQQLAKITISLQCWQGDDVAGFESRANALSGGIITTGSYPGKARNATELRLDLEQALSLIPGRHKVNLHAIYADGDDNRVERNHLEPKHFTNWVTWAKKMGIGLDFNPTLFSHRYAKDGLTLSHPDANIRQFWIEHCQASRRIGAYFGKELGEPALTNIWIPDGYKDLPSDRLSPRARLKASLDEIFKEEFDSSLIIDSLESKVFGIGMEAYTVGSHEFYLNYANQNHKICLLDNGHFHPTESVADKISSMLLYFDKIALHLTRPMRWDSDHVVLFDEEIKEIAKELVRTKALDRVMIGLDFFDASINRVAAWVIGARSVLKSLLYAMLMPHDYLKSLQDKGDFTTLLALTEEFKSYPMGDLWDYYCLQHNVPIRESWLEEIHRYESDVLSQRK